MRRIPMRWPYRADGKDLFVQIAERAKQALVNQRSASEPNGVNLTALNRYQRIDDFIACLQQELG